MKNKVSILMLFCFMLLGSLLDAPRADALDCAELSDIEEVYDYYDAIILGTVDKVKSKNNYHHVTIKVERSFKALTDRQLEIREDAHWGSIIIGPSEVGDHILYFLTDRGTYFENTLCSPSKEFTAASAELKYLAEKEIPLFSLPEEDFHLESISSHSLTVWIIVGVVIVLLPFIIWLWRRGRS